ncbi:MAG: hypothetical protein AAF492_06550 [Verrucomicrobiota bacterium]
MYRLTRAVYWAFIIPLTLFLIPFHLLRFFCTPRGLVVFLLLLASATAVFTAWTLQLKAAHPVFASLKWVKPAHPMLCRYNLRGLAKAKQTWAAQTGRVDGDECRLSDLSEQINLKWFSCPSGGDYTIGRVGTLPACSVSNHVFRGPLYSD